jgi:dTMP kinase
MQYFLIFFIIILTPFQIFSKGRLIEVCGIDGTGKSTFIQDIKEALIEKGRKVTILRPVSGHPAIYKLLNELDSLPSEGVSPKIQDRIERFKSDYFLFEFLKKKDQITKLLLEDYDVLCDRYLFSFRTYQECFNQSTEEEFLKDFPKADIVFFVNVPVEIAIQRINERSTPPASYENLTFLKKAQKVFLKNMNKYSRIVLINGENNRKINVEEALSSLNEWK